MPQQKLCLQTVDDVLAYWFDGVTTREERREKMSSHDFFNKMAPKWFMGRDADFIRVQTASAELVHRAGRDELHDGEWATPRGYLALILLTDQFPRSIWRGTAEAYQYDERAQALSAHVVDHGWDKTHFYYAERIFIYLPFEHSERVEHQRRAVELMKNAASDTSWRLWFHNRFGVNVRMAKQHLRIIERFGRFPYRNDVLGRESTPDELRWLASPDLPIFARSQLSEKTRAALAEYKGHAAGDGSAAGRQTNHRSGSSSWTPIKRTAPWLAAATAVGLSATAAYRLYRIRQSQA
ncbi:hypothetical protein CDCA_CDCA15G4077 [Cyanidium caldarium]|uniref:DUF924 domain-containing protein n=1 Tax=Cyanidium caldarium TaxID=2771 RepID=A0AAV9J0E1_CYACA|nr:hypothetical protein CDCA_CDCA15G4077 [Cyanidium caldarium]|eukprot:ctg_20.g3